MNDRSREPLSSAGESRREAMLDELVELSGKIHRRRQTRRRYLVAGTSMCLFAVLLWAAIPRGTEPEGSPQIVDQEQPPEVDVPDEPIANDGESVVKLVHTRTAVLARFASEPTRRIERLDDGKLLAVLASLGRPAELIRDGDRVRLSAPVTDKELHIER